MLSIIFILLIFLIWIAVIIFVIKFSKTKNMIKNIYFEKNINPNDFKQMLDNELKNKYRTELKNNKIEVIQDKFIKSIMFIKEKNGKIFYSGPIGIISNLFRMIIVLFFYILFFILYLGFNVYRSGVASIFLFWILVHIFLILLLVSINNTSSKKLLIELSAIIKKFSSISQIINRKFLFTLPLFLLMIFGFFLINALAISTIFYSASKNISTEFSRVQPEILEEGTKIKPVSKLEYLNIENPIRQELLDRKQIHLMITLGYKANNKMLQQEINSIIPEIRDIVIKHLSKLRSADLTEEKLEEDFLRQINRILNNGKIERVLFREFTLM